MVSPLVLRSRFWREFFLEAVDSYYLRCSSKTSRFCCFLLGLLRYRNRNASSAALRNFVFFFFRNSGAAADGCPVHGKQGSLQDRLKGEDHGRLKTWDISPSRSSKSCIFSLDHSLNSKSSRSCQDVATCCARAVWYTPYLANMTPHP